MTIAIVRVFIEAMQSKDKMLIGQELTFTDRKAQKELGCAPVMTRNLG